MATTTIKNSAGADVTVELPLAPGQAARAASRPVTLATEDVAAITGAAIPAGSNAIGTVGVTALPALPAGSNAIGTVGVTALPAIPAGANLIGSATAVGSVAHDGVASGNPVQVAAFASAAAPTAVSASGDVVRLWALLNGALAVNLTAAGALIPGDAANGLDVDVTRMSALVAGSALIGDVALALRATTNGLTSSRVLAAATTNATSLKASAGRIARIDLFNTAASLRYLKLYNKASAPTVGTDTPVWTIPLPPGSGFSSDFPFGKYLATGIAYAITAALADGDTTAVAAGDVTGSIDWI